MADQSGEPGMEQNPFSFRTFLHSSAKSEETVKVQLNKNDCASKPDNDIPDEDSLLAVNDESVSNVDDNPFSFRHYTRKDATSPKPNSKMPYTQSFNDASNNPYLHERGQSSDLFVTDLSELSHQSSFAVRRSDDIGCVVNTNEQSADFLINRERSSCQNAANRLVDNSGLADFLADGQTLWSNGLDTLLEDHISLSKSICPQHSNPGPDPDLEEENALLMLKLEQAQVMLSAESQKVISLERQVEILCKKEADEAKVLENIIEDVENNLQGAVERATIAETTNAKLKQDMKCLQAQVNHLLKENERLRGVEASLNEVKRKSNLTSTQITESAAIAEHKLKELLDGVSSLKILAACLSQPDTKG